MVLLSCNKKEKSELPIPKANQEVHADDQGKIRDSTPKDKGKKPVQWSDEIVDGSSLKKDPPWTIGVSNYSLGNSWRVHMFAELQYAADNNPDIKDLVITNADGDVSKQISDVEDLMAKGIDALLITPLSSKALVSVVEDAYDEGIPVVIFNAEIDTDRFHSIVWVDEYKFGWIGGAWLKEQLGGSGKVVMLDGIAGNSTSELRAQGAIDAMGSSIEILGRQAASWAYDKGKAAMEDFIVAFPEIDGVYSQGGAMSQGVIEALKAAGRPLIPVTGEGYNGFLKEWVRNQDNGFTSIGPDEPTWQSTEALKQALKLLRGEKVQKWHEMKLPVITDENVADYALMDFPDGVWANTKMDIPTLEKLYGREQ